MKKLILLVAIVFVSSLSFVSCSSEKEDANIDLIIGTWYYFSENGKEGSDCEKKTFFSFSADGKLTGTNYSSSKEEACKSKTRNWLLPSAITTTWKKDSDGLYSLTGKDIEGDTLKHKFKPVFSDNNKSMTVIDNTESNDYYFVFKKK